MRFANKVIKRFKQYLTRYTAMFIVFRETAFIISLYNIISLYAFMDNHY